MTCHILGSFSCRVLVFVLFEKLRDIFIGDIHKSWSGHFDKTAKQIFPPNLTPGARHQLKYNVQPDWSNQIITFYLIGQFQPWSDMISFHGSEMISYSFSNSVPISSSGSFSNSVLRSVSCSAFNLGLIWSGISWYCSGFPGGARRRRRRRQASLK